MPGDVLTTMDPEISGILGEMPEVAQMLGHVAGEKPAAAKGGDDDGREDAGGDEVVADGGEAPEGEESEDGTDGSDGSDRSDESDGSEDEDSGDKPVSRNVQKRIDKLVAQREEHAARVKALEAELDALKSREPEVVVAPTAGNPLADITDEGALEQRLQRAVALKRWAIENPQGGSIRKPDGEEVAISEEQVRGMLADAEEEIAIHIPKRAQWLRDARAQEQVAREVYPSLFAEGSEDAVRARSILKAWPELTRFPDYKMVIGDYLAGVRAREERAANAAKEKAKAPAVRKLAPPVPKVAAPPVKQGKQQQQTGSSKGVTVDRVIQAGGSRDAIFEYLQEQAA